MSEELARLVTRNKGRGRADAFYAYFIRREDGGAFTLSSAYGSWDRYVATRRTSGGFDGAGREMSRHEVAALAGDALAAEMAKRIGAKGYQVVMSESIGLEQFPIVLASARTASEEWQFDPPAPVAVDIGWVRPMKARGIHVDDLYKVADMGRWRATVKRDGYRAHVMRLSDDELAVFSSAGRRMASVESAWADLPLAVGASLDGELVVRDASVCDCYEGPTESHNAVAHFRANHPKALGLAVITALHHEGAYLGDLPQREQQDYATRIIRNTNDPRVWRVQECHPNGALHIWMQGQQSLGAEGVVFWRRDSTYEPGGRPKTQLKHKWEQDHIDVVVSATDAAPVSQTGTWQPGGYADTMERPLLRLRYGWHDSETGEVEDAGVLLCSEMPPAQAKAAVGTVVEARCNEIVPQTRTLRFAAFVRFRPDKLPDECTFEAALMVGRIMGNSKEA